MGADQIAQMARSIAKVYEGMTTADDAPALLCTFESTTSSGAPVWIQVLPGNVNMAYPFTEEPLELLRQRGVRSSAGFISSGMGRGRVCGVRL